MRRAACAAALLTLLGCGARGGGGGGGGGGADDAEVTVDGLSATLDATYTCTPGGDAEVQCADYTLLFTLQNHSPDALASLERVDLAIGAEFTATSGPTFCDEDPWLVGGEASSDTIRVAFVYDGIEGLPTLFHPCGGSQVTRTGGGFGAAPLDGEVTLDLEGTTDGGAWSASATAPLQTGER